MQSEIQDVIDLEFYQPIDKEGKLCEENMKLNIESAKRANETVERILARTKFISDDIEAVFLKRTQFEVLVQA